jgi:hypothetical protein
MSIICVCAGLHACTQIKCSWLSDSSVCVCMCVHAEGLVRGACVAKMAQVLGLVCCVCVHVVYSTAGDVLQVMGRWRPQHAYNSCIKSTYGLAGYVRLCISIHHICLQIRMATCGLKFMQQPPCC